MQCPPKPGTRIERREAKRLGFRSFDHFPNIDTHRVIDHLKLVNECDIDCAKNVLGEFHCLSSFSRRNSDNAVHNRTIKRTNQFSRVYIISAYDFGNGSG